MFTQQNMDNLRDVLDNVKKDLLFIRQCDNLDAEEVGKAFLQYLNKHNMNALAAVLDNVTEDPGVCGDHHKVPYDEIGEAIVSAMRDRESDGSLMMLCEWVRAHEDAEDLEGGEEQRGAMPAYSASTDVWKLVRDVVMARQALKQKYNAQNLNALYGAIDKLGEML